MGDERHIAVPLHPAGYELTGVVCNLMNVMGLQYDVRLPSPWR